MGKSKIVFATNNVNKAKEIQQLLGEQFKVLTLKEIDFNGDIEETAKTFEGNAAIKAQFVFDHFGLNCFADDSGLEIEALNQEPGIYSARYAGNEKNDQANMDLVLEKLNGLSNRNAQFRTVLALVLNGKTYFFEGSVKGIISVDKMGNNGFGYDPIFIPDGHNLTFAQMDMNQKNTLSHRGIAFKKMIAFLKSHQKDFEKNNS